MQISVLWIVSVKVTRVPMLIQVLLKNDVNEGSDAVKDLMQSGKAGLIHMHVYSNH